MRFCVPAPHVIFPASAALAGGGNFEHGLSDSRLEKILEKMKSRCYNPNEDSYSRYGGRGITICDAWLKDSGAFYSWTLQNGYRDDLQIDRKRVDEAYSPNNCRWITHGENQTIEQPPNGI